MDLRRAQHARRGPVPWLVGGLFLVLLVLTVSVWLDASWVADVDGTVGDAAYDLVHGHGTFVAVLEWVATWLGPLVLRVVLLAVAAYAAYRRAWRLAIWIVLSVVVEALAVWGMKAAIGRARPVWDDPISTIGGYAFPSGHAAAGAMFATVMTIVTLVLVRRGLVRRLLVVVWVAVGLAAAADRVLLGVHSLTDVVAGVALGILVPVVLWLVVTAAVFAEEPPAHPTVAGTGQRQVAVVLNPVKVGDVETFRTRVADAAQRHGWAAPVFFETTADDPGVSQAAAALESDADLVVVAGGDGTVRVVCDELARTGVSVGVVPLGTGNLLARNLGIPLHVVDAVDNAFVGQDRAVDIVQVRLDDEPETAFLVMAGLGFDAAIMTGADEDLKKRVGWLAYVLSAVKQLFRFPRTRVRISVDGGDFVKRRALTVVIGNVGFLQGGLPLLPDAQIDDGALDVVAIAPPHKLAFLSVGLRLFTRRRRIDERLDRMTGQEVVVKANEPTPMQLDGDPVGEHTKLRARVEPGVLLVRVPR
ncbi:UNVERIFIED_CONTAM: hypothetical protein LK11_38100 [Mumia flava]